MAPSQALSSASPSQAPNNVFDAGAQCVAQHDAVTGAQCITLALPCPPIGCVCLWLVSR